MNDLKKQKLLEIKDITKELFVLNIELAKNLENLTARFMLKYRHKIDNEPKKESESNHNAIIPLVTSTADKKVKISALKEKSVKEQVKSFESSGQDKIKKTKRRNKHIHAKTNLRKKVKKSSHRWH